MSDEVFIIIEICGISGVALCVVGFVALNLAVRAARREFRVKGYLRPPSGTDWFRFLLWKQYEYFESPGTRFYFGTSHICMIATMVVVTLVVVLVGSEFFFNGLNGTSPGTPPMPPGQ